MKKLNQKTTTLLTLLLLSPAAALAASYGSAPVVTQSVQPAPVVVHETVAPVYVQQEKAWNRHTGLYIGGSIGSDALFVNTKHFHSGDVLAANLNGGIDLTEHLGLELGYTALGKHLYMPYAAAKLALPLGDNFKLSAKLGAAHTSNKKFDKHFDKDKVRAYVGLTASYALSPNLDLDAGMQSAIDKFDHDVVGLGMVGIGLTYHFS